MTVKLQKQDVVLLTDFNQPTLGLRSSVGALCNVVGGR